MRLSSVGPGTILALAICMTTAGCVTPSGVASSAPVRLKPGDDIMKIVSRYSENTVFTLSPGDYRRQYIEPRDGQKFIGDDGAILSGAMVMTGWRREGAFWVGEDMPSPLPLSGYCKDDGDVCKHREDLFVGGVLFQRVLDQSRLKPGRWFYAKGVAYLAEDPAGREVELSVTPRAFGGRAKNVVLENLVVEKYASPAQGGAIDLHQTSGWKLRNMSVRWNHGMGLYIGPGTRVDGGSYNHNGQMGMGGIGDGTVIDGPEIAFNNYADFMQNWEAGGFKFAYSKGITVRNACVHDNKGVGMWNDIDNIDTLFENNRVFDNSGLGIAQEISYTATIRNNIIARNGKDQDQWLWGSQILLQNSQNADVYGNTVEVAAGFGNGISIIFQERGKGAYGPYLARNNRIHDNVIRHLAAHGHNGLVADYDKKWFRTKSNNHFDANTYIVPDAKDGYWLIYDGYQDWQTVRSLGMEKNGRLIERKETPLKITCAK